MIHDLQGRLVTEVVLKTNNNKQSVDVSNLSTGVYVVRLKNEFQEKTQKVIIK